MMLLMHQEFILMCQVHSKASTSLAEAVFACKAQLQGSLSFNWELVYVDPGAGAFWDLPKAFTKPFTRLVHVAQSLCKDNLKACRSL